MGSISHTGPKTSRAARDRPELNPRRNQPSRHRRRLAGAAAGDGATTTNITAAAHYVARNVARLARIVRRSWRNDLRHGLPSLAASARTWQPPRATSGALRRRAAHNVQPSRTTSSHELLWQITRCSRETAATIDRRSGATMHARARPSTKIIAPSCAHRVLMLVQPHAAAAGCPESFSIQFSI
ncbi:hypothetical protein F511_30680 [Dorcoceras hygrometricum]|uniref:Uncharacterized protein n=1 Tax=Dorcoceras hygrometricum TaxID=472368 RepID=A0A2Z7B530_9LAMI|nr:hypothetical protein F511_30680 [Dorcoceras hygrometricum]